MRRVFLHLIVASLLALPRPALADNEPRLGFRVNTYSLSGRIGGDNVSAVAQTGDGYLWVGTHLGLFRFDGDRFVSASDFLPLPRLPVSALHARGQTLFVATPGHGFFRIQEQDVARFDSASGLADDVVWRFHDGPDERLWIATSDGISELRGNTLTSIEGVDGIVRYVAGDDAGNLVFVSGAGIPQRLARGSASAEVIDATPVYALLDDASGRVWFGTQRGLKVAASASAAPVDVPALVDKVIVALAETPGGELWAATASGEIWQRSGDSWALRRLTARLPSPAVNVLATDSQGGLWIGTRKGLAQVSGGAVIELGPTLSGPDVWAVTRDAAGRVFMASDGGGIHRVDVDALSLSALDVDLPSAAIWSLAPAPDGGLWAGSANAGAFKIRNGRVIRQIADLPVPQVWSVLEKDDGTVYVGTDGGGLLRLDGRGRRLFDTGSGLAGDRVWALHATPDGTLWIGTNHGLCTLRNEFLECRDTSAGLPGDAVWSLAASRDGGLWVCTDAGLAQVTADGRLRAVRREPLSSANVFGVEYDASGDLWAVSAQGLHRIRQADVDRLFDPPAGGAPLGRTLGPADGLNQTLISGASPAMALDDQGGLWLATGGGLVLVQTDALGDEVVPVSLRIQSLAADGTPYPVTGAALRLPPGTRTLSVSYTPLAFRHPGEARVEYRLRGVTDEWSTPTLSRELLFSNPPAGEYRLEIRLAPNSFGMQSPPTAIDFAVAPYWHQRTDVRAGAALLALLLLWAGYRLRVRAVTARHEEREAATRRQLEASRALAASKSRIEDIFANMNDLLFCVDREQVIIEANPAARRLLPGCRVGERLDRVLPAEAIEQAADRPWRWQLETLDGRERTLDLRSARASSDSTLFVARDISDEVRLQAQVAAAARIESIGKLTAGVAHDFNNLLTIIQGNASLLDARLGDHDGAPLVSAIVEAADCAGDITSKLLSIGRRQTITPQRIALNEHLKNMSSLLESTLSDGIELRFEFGAEAVVEVDSALLQQILLNLVVNARDAIDATGAAGTITLRTRDVDVDAALAARLATVQPGRYARLRVQDTGAGMDERTRQRLFEPFFSTKAPGVGAGLGMATVYGAVMQSDGAIAIDSEVGRGTRIDVYLPLSDGAPATTSPSDAPSSANGSASVLVVDDDERILSMVRHVLEGRHYSVTTASSADEALRAFDGDHFDLLISDVVIGSDSGPRLVAELRARRAGVAALLISGYAHAHRHELASIDVTLLPKPFNADELLAVVQQELERR